MLSVEKLIDDPHVNYNDFKKIWFAFNAGKKVAEAYNPGFYDITLMDSSGLELFPVMSIQCEIQDNKLVNWFRFQTRWFDYSARLEDDKEVFSIFDMKSSISQQFGANFHLYRGCITYDHSWYKKPDVKNEDIMKKESYQKKFSASMTMDNKVILRCSGEEMAALESAVRSLQRVYRGKIA